MLIIPLVLVVATSCAASHPVGYQGDGNACDTSVLDCSGYLSLSKAARSTALNTSDPITEYSSTGTKDWASPENYYESKCAEPGNSKRTLGKIAPNPPTCDAWEKLPDTIKAVWVRAELKPVAAQAADLKAALAALSDADAIAAAEDTCKPSSTSRSDFSNTMTTVTALARQNLLDATTATALQLTTAWKTTSKLGYTVAVTLRLASKQLEGVETHPLSTDAKVGSACGYDATKDIAFAAQLYDVNTASSDAPVQSAVELNHQPSSATRPAVTTGYIDSGDYCSPEKYGVSTLNIHQSTPVKPGKGFGILFFVIIKDYYSPRYPTGAKNELADYTLTKTTYAGTTLTDPIVDTTPNQASIQLGAH